MTAATTLQCPRCQAANPAGARFCHNCGGALDAPRPVEGERKFVTVLFADVVGSTAMGERLDPEQVIDVMNGAFALLNAAVARYGGTVARLMGDAILAFFGAPQAHEDDPERAVRAGLEIRAAASEYARAIERAYGVEFDVRVGIHTGLAVLAVVGDEIKTEYTAMGDTTNLASRLQNAADPGTVLISAETRRLVQGAFELKPRGAIEVKGKSEPLEVYEVLAPRTTPGNPRGLPGLHSPLVGRDAESRLLRERVAGLRGTAQERAGQGAFVAVIGEAGLGKSRLVAEVRETAVAGAQPPVTWLEARTVSYGQPAPYYLWQQLLRQSIGAQPEGAPEDARRKLQAACELRAIAEDDRPFLEALLAIEGEQSRRVLEGVEGETLRQRITAATRAYFGAGARLAPTALALDDLHWADTASLDLLLEVAGLTTDHPLLLICLLRPDKDAPSWSAIERARAALGPRFVELALEPLSVAQASQLLGSLLDVRDLPESVRALVLAKAEGNPFFVEEVLRALIDSGHIVREDGHWRATREIAQVAIPDTLSGVLTARLDRLPEETKRVAQAAAVLGRSFAQRVLHALCADAPPPERIAPLAPHLVTLTHEELVRERAREPELEYSFKHALTRDAAYDLLLLRRRKELHRRAGAILEQLHAVQLDEHAPALAHHFWLAEEWARAAEYATRAGARARQLYARREALAQLDRACRALEHLADEQPERLIDAILTWTDLAIQVQLGAAILERLARAERLARELGDRRRLAQALVWVANAHLLSGFPSRAFPALAESYELANGLGDERLTILPAFVLTGSLVDTDPHLALARFEEVIALARKHHNLQIEAHALATKGWAHARLGQFAEAREAIERAVALAPATGFTMTQADVDIQASFAYLDMGDAQRALEHAWSGTTRSLGARGLECSCAGYLSLGLGHLQANNPGEALTAFEEAARLTEVFSGGDEPFTNRIHAMRAAADVLNGRAAAMVDLDGALANARTMDDQFGVAFISEALGAGATLQGDFGRAAAALDEALEFYRRNDMRPYQARVLRALAELYEAQGQLAEAGQAREEAERLTEALQRPVAADETSLAPAVDRKVLTAKEPVP